MDEGREGRQSRALFKGDIRYQRQADEMRERESIEFDAQCTVGAKETLCRAV